MFEGSERHGSPVIARVVSTAVLLVVVCLAAPAGVGADAANGAVIYRQRCAFCHGADGEGRYASGTYYRPALWGPRSFDAHAGMARPATFAAFVHANMPLGSGGALTEQEAWDLAGFVDGQCRPKKPGC